MSKYKRHQYSMHLKVQLWHQQKERCAWCEARILPSDLGSASVDHWIPLAHARCGGNNASSNFRIMHPECNFAKDQLCPVCNSHQLMMWRKLRVMVSREE